MKTSVKNKLLNEVKIILALIIGLTFNSSSKAQDIALELIKEVSQTVGGEEKFKSLKDVEYEYTFRSKEKGIKDVSIERYIFDQEKSFAKYNTREYFALPTMEGVLTQNFDGKRTESKINNTVIADQQPVYVGHFFRKTNYYWFAMMFKLQDPGINYKMMEERKWGDIDYKVVEMTFSENIGETSDRYILYINPETKLIDQFLFTVKGFGIEDPFLMKVKYQDINGLKLTTYRTYAPANWDGEVIKEEWNEQISQKIIFNNGFTSENITNI